MEVTETLQEVAARRRLAQEEKERQKREEKQALEAAQRVQRMSQVEALVAKRTDNFAYLKELHSEGGYWLNVVLLTKDILAEFVQKEIPKTRVNQLFFLGVSLGKILDIPSGPSVLQAVLQLFEEWEYWMAGSTTQGMKWVLAKSSTNPYPKSSKTPLDPEEAVKGSLYRFHSEVIYERLCLPELSIEIDYFELIISLSETLTLIYKKFLESDCYSNALIFDALMRMDGKVKQHIVQHIAKEYTEFSMKLMQDEISELRS